MARHSRQARAKSDRLVSAPGAARVANHAAGWADLRGADCRRYARVTSVASLTRSRGLAVAGSRGASLHALHPANQSDQGFASAPNLTINVIKSLFSKETEALCGDSLCLDLEKRSS